MKITLKDFKEAIKIMPTDRGLFAGIAMVKGCFFAQVTDEYQTEKEVKVDIDKGDLDFTGFIIIPPKDTQ